MLGKHPVAITTKHQQWILNSIPFQSVVNYSNTQINSLIKAKSNWKKIVFFALRLSLSPLKRAKLPCSASISLEKRKHNKHQPVDVLKWVTLPMWKRNEVLQIQAPTTKQTSDSYLSCNRLTFKFCSYLFYPLLLERWNTPSSFEFKDLNNFIQKNSALISSLLS